MRLNSTRSRQNSSCLKNSIFGVSKIFCPASQERTFAARIAGSTSATASQGSVFPRHLWRNVGSSRTFDLSRKLTRTVRQPTEIYKVIGHYSRRNTRFVGLSFHSFRPLIIHGRADVRETGF